MSRIFPLAALALATAGLGLAGCSDNAEQNGDTTANQGTTTLNVYSARKEDLIAPLLDRFTDETGIEVQLLTAKAGALLSRLESEGRNTPADLLITVDAGNLQRAKEAGVFQAIDSATLTDRIPANLRDVDNQWFGLSQRARVIFTHKENVEEGAITSYADLADPKFKGKICIRSSDNVYNQSLVASLIAEHGEEWTEEWAKGLVANMARKPQGGDRDQIRAVAAGECDIAVANTYYYGAMQNGSDTDREAADAVRLVWPNQDDRGAHVNVSGAGMVAASDKTEAVTQLLEFLTTEASQEWYAQVNNEFPVRPGVPAAETLAQWGEFKADDLNLSKLGELNPAAVKLMDRAGWQ
ncbi:Fe(3+) ABC transporter substrate-binding protein [Guyparkeria hydrothermalis]|uniref:Fe(3+) ABC transporter substrate-binding protein n=1 Tax=Guyparkeria hydrothermalis TaxID=923 RepID=UPI00202241FD|nr:Fe(3+) ABC transporter substrate-binding protein [Guyparkeria hydrothermalis]MCL7751870.1 Fe(3+) ABC transporter substrate-binding protein [Guyparkeria hydrothermalis]